jgi:uncharacterized protein YkwD
MKTSQIALLCAAAFACVLPSCSSPSAPVTRMPVSSTLGNDSSLSGQVLREVNSYRASKGKSALTRHTGLDRLAQQHCDYLVKTRGSYGLHGSNVSHMGFEGRATLARHKYSISSIGENVASSTTKSANHLVNLWIGSKGHEHNMRGDWTCTGIGTAVTPEGSVISTQIFGTNPGGADLDHPSYFNGFR